ncbi:MAG: hypothetical protein IKZ58_08315 [Selenomonadaceae bacterium]|nr:hypothetical protein [Selenomonadaceae bacterium]
MTDDEKKKCHAIIHSHAVAAGAGNLLPIPGTGLAADTITMTTMAMALAGVFGGSIPESIARNMAVNAIITAVKQNAVKTVVKEVSKVVPILGQIISPSISVAMLESAGWSLAQQLDDERNQKLLKSGD